MKALILGQAGLVVMLGDDPVAHPIAGGRSIDDPYVIARSLDGCSDLAVVEVGSVDEAQTIGLASLRSSQADVRRSLADEGFASVEPQPVVNAPPVKEPAAPEPKLRSARAKAGKRFFQDQVRALKARPVTRGISVGGLREGAVVVAAARRAKLAAEPQESHEALVTFLTKQIKARRNRHGVNHGLQKLIHRRRQLLAELKRQDEARYNHLVQLLGIRR